MNKKHYWKLDIQQLNDSHFYTKIEECEVSKSINNIKQFTKNWKSLDWKRSILSAQFWKQEFYLTISLIFKHGNYTYFYQEWNLDLYNINLYFNKMLTYSLYWLFSFLLWSRLARSWFLCVLIQFVPW